MRKNIKMTLTCIAAAIMMAGSVITLHAQPSLFNGELFDADYYAANNPDVVAALGTGAEVLFNHYITFGQAEGRLPYHIFNNPPGVPSAIPVPSTTPAPDTAAAPTANAVLSEEDIRSAICALKDTYPEGTKWDNDNYYQWKGGNYFGGYGCAGFSFMLSDAAFGDAKSTMYYDVSAIKVGDIARLNNNTHSVIILEIRPDSVIVAEGNYGGSVHWGREISKSELENAAYFMTRY